MPIEKHYEFDGANLLSARAVGVPGKRTFFLIIGQQDKWVRVWLEKNALESLALAIEQLLQTLAHEHIKIGRGPGNISDNLPSRFPSAELEVDEMTLGYDRGKAMLSLLVHGVGPQREIQSEVQGYVTLSQLEKLCEEAKAACAAGRPLCPICGGPIDPSGHICPASN